MPIYDVTIRGVALEVSGLTEWDTFDGFALLTKGLLYECKNIWYGPWTSTGATLISTTWSSYTSTGTLIATNWSLVTGLTVPTVWVTYSTNNIEEC